MHFETDSIKAVLEYENILGASPMPLGNNSVGVVGAGPVGCLMSVALAQRGYDVTLLEYRDDPRLESTTDRNLRSINLAISARGISSMAYVDRKLFERVFHNFVPMKGRMVHDKLGGQKELLYGINGEEINSISRSFLNNDLLNELAYYSSNIHVLFGHKLHKIDFTDTKQSCHLTTRNGETTLQFDFIIGSDGCFSTTRNQLQRNVRMNYKQEYIDCCYIELYMPPKKQGGFAISKDHLHIWPRDNFLLIALPNADGSFTSTFFGPWSLVDSLVKSESRTKEFLATNFPDAMALMDLEKTTTEFINNPKSPLMCVECNPYHLSNGSAILIGDAAHSMVPFYGQGLNCGFEDVRVLIELFDKYHGDRVTAFQKYTETRFGDLVTINRLARENYTELSHNVNSIWFNLYKHIDESASRLFRGKWFGLYTMISFNSDISYSEAARRATKQKAIVKWTIAGVALTAMTTFVYHLTSQ